MLNDLISKIENDLNYKCTRKEKEIIKNCTMVNIPEDNIYIACKNCIEIEGNLKKIYNPAQIKKYMRNYTKIDYPLWFNEITNDNIKNELKVTYEAIIEWCTGYSNYVNKEILESIYLMYENEKVPFSIQVKYFKYFKQLSEYEILQHYKDKENFKGICRELYKRHNEFKKQFTINNIGKNINDL